MKTHDLGSMISICANIGVIAGIAFLAYELRQNTIATRIASAQNVITNIGDQNNLVIENEDLLASIIRADEGADLTRNESIRLRVFYSNALRGWQSLYFQYESGALDEALWGTQRQEMALTLRSYPSFREHWEQRRELYMPAFNELLDSLVDSPPQN